MRPGRLMACTFLMVGMACAYPVGSVRAQPDSSEAFRSLFAGLIEQIVLPQIKGHNTDDEDEYEYEDDYDDDYDEEDDEDYDEEEEDDEDYDEEEEDES